MGTVFKKNVKGGRAKEGRGETNREVGAERLSKQTPLRH